MVDLSRVKVELARLAGPASVGLGQDGMHKALKDLVKVFEQDKKKQDEKNLTSKKGQ